MMNKTLLLVGVLSAFTLIGCGGDDNPTASISNPTDNGPALDAAWRVTHASPDAPDVNIYVNGNEILSNVPYGVSSGDIAVPAGSFEVEVRGVAADGTEIPGVIGPVTLTVASGERLDVVAYDDLLNAEGGLNIKPNLITAPLTSDASEARVSVLHAAPDVADVDIYLTAPGATLEGVTPIDAGFGASAGPLGVAAGTYQVRIAPDGSDTIVFNGEVTVRPGDDLLVTAIENTSGINESTRPVNLIVAGERESSIVYDNDIGAEVRVVHNSADTIPVDILIDGTEVLDAVPYPAASQYQDIAAPAGTYNVVVAADVDNSIAPIDVNVALMQGKSYTAIAVGGLNNITDNTLELLLTEDNRRTIATGSYLRVVHGSYAVAEEIPVDVYLTATADISEATPAITNLAYGEFTDQLLVPGADYYVTVTAAGDASVVALAVGPLMVEAGNNYTVIARDPGTEEVGAPLITATVLWDNEEEAN